MENPQPGAGHRMLEKFIGDWTGDEMLHPSPWDPKGGPASGKISNTWELDGFFVIQDYEGTRDGKIGYRGHGVFGFDAMNSQHTMHWFDGMGGASEYRGGFEGDVLTLSSRNAMGFSRAIFNFGEPGEYSFKMEYSEDGQQWSPFMEGSYTKK